MSKQLRGVLSDCPAMGKSGRTIADPDGRFAGSGKTIVEALKAFMQAAVDAGVGRVGEIVDVVLEPQQSAEHGQEERD